MSNVETLYEKARLLMGATPEIRLRKARARTFVMTLILKRQAESQRVTQEMLNREITL